MSTKENFAQPLSVFSSSFLSLCLKQNGDPKKDRMLVAAPALVVEFLWIVSIPERGLLLPGLRVDRGRRLCCMFLLAFLFLYFLVKANDGIQRPAPSRVKTMDADTFKIITAMANTILNSLSCKRDHNMVTMQACNHCRCTSVNGFYQQLTLLLLFIGSLGRWVLRYW